MARKQQLQQLQQQQPKQLQQIPSVIPEANGSQTLKQKIAERNYRISCQFQSGVKIQELMDEYKLSKRQVYRIVNKHVNSATKWASEIPESTVVVMCQFVVRKAFQMITDIEASIRIAEEQGDTALALQYKVKLFDCCQKYCDLLKDVKDSTRMQWGSL